MFIRVVLIHRGKKKKNYLLYWDAPKNQIKVDL